MFFPKLDIFIFKTPLNFNGPGGRVKTSALNKAPAQRSLALLLKIPRHKIYARSKLFKDIIQNKAAQVNLPASYILL